MQQLPIFLNLTGCKVILAGEGEAADAKRRLIERAGGICVGIDDKDARVAFVALEDGAEELADHLRTRGLLVNVVDRPELCDFTTPAIVDRDPMLIAVGTGGASAGLAKAVRQRIEALLPPKLGKLAQNLHSARSGIRARWPDGATRRRAIDAALAGPLNPLDPQAHENVDRWLAGEDTNTASGMVIIALQSNNPDDLTLGQARLLGEADHVFHDARVDNVIINRARADAVRHMGEPSDPLPVGLVLWLQLRAQ